MLREIPQFIPSHQKKSLFSAIVRFREGQRSCVFDSLFKNIYQNFDYSNGDLNIEANDHKHQKIKIFKNN
jgi:hypothetical protein